MIMTLETLFGPRTVPNFQHHYFRIVIFVLINHTISVIKYEYFYSIIVTNKKQTMETQVTFKIPSVCYLNLNTLQVVFLIDAWNVSCY